MTGAHDLVERVMRLWREGYDTWDMHNTLDEDEWEICRALRIGREQQRTSKAMKK